MIMKDQLLQNLAEAERILNLKYWSYLGGSSLSEIDKEKFEILHFQRNYYNTDANAVSSLRQIYYSSWYEDNSGKKWFLLPSIMNKYHMPEDEYTTGVLLGISKPWSRKFVRWDNKPWGGEFELIVKGNGEVLNGASEAHGTYLGTYNYGKTANGLKHKYLDINPHLELAHKMHSYSASSDTEGSVNVIESSLSEV